MALTAYDYATARLVDEAGVDMILVGDSLAMVVMGYDNTLAVTMDEMLLHTRAVRRAVKHAMVVADMPFGSYQVSTAEGIANATRFLKEAGAQAVKLEGGASRLELVKRLTDAEIPVMAHLGLNAAVGPPHERIPGPGQIGGGHPSPGERRTRPGSGRRLRGGARRHSLRSGAAHHRRSPHPSHWHRRRTALRWADPGAARSHQPVFLAPPRNSCAAMATPSALITDAVHRYRDDVEGRNFPGEAESYHLGKEAMAALLLEEGTARRKA